MQVDAFQINCLSISLIFFDLESGLGGSISNNKNIQISGLKPFPPLEGTVNC